MKRSEDRTHQSVTSISFYFCFPHSHSILKDHPIGERAIPSSSSLHHHHRPFPPLVLDFPLAFGCPPPSASPRRTAPAPSSMVSCKKYLDNLQTLTRSPPPPRTTARSSATAALPQIRIPDNGKSERDEVARPSRGRLFDSQVDYDFVMW
jgi:hypothetical protein